MTELVEVPELPAVTSFSRSGETRVATGGADPVWSEHSDQDLLFAPGDTREGAYAELRRRHSASIAAVVRTVLGSGAECDDIVAEVFVELWYTPEKFDPQRGSLLGFLRMKARGRSIDRVRSDSSRRRREQDGFRSPSVAPPEVDASLLAEETSLELKQAVAALPVAERLVIHLAYFGGMTYQAVASHLGLPEGTVKSRIRSGLRRLREGSDSRARLSPRETPTSSAASPFDSGEPAVEGRK